MGLRLTARLRLTLLFSALFLCTGGLLLGLNYTLVRYRLQFLPLPLIQAQGVGDRLLVESAPAAGDLEPQPVQVPAPSPAELATLHEVQARVVAASLRELLLQSLLALSVMAGLVVWLSWLVAGRVLRPVAQMTAVARQLSEARLHERIALTGPRDEMKELADTFDSMLARLERAFAAQSRFAASASHELRTPLTIMRTELEVTLTDPHASASELRAMGETVCVAVARCERLIDGLLLLARSEQAITNHEPGDLAYAVELALEPWATTSVRLGLRTELHLAPAPTWGDQALLERLVSNLVENAVRYNVPGGLLRIITISDGDSATLVVENDGLLIPAEAVESLFLPFRRLGGERTGAGQGAGLGLSIARAVAEAHDGSLHAGARPQGGLRLALSLPT